ncbi:MAG: GGDEF domain-containing protein [Pseudomonadota bacterium]|nr:GGDEF domain-containing protein [Pseudomonadota bacterium]
MTDLRISIPGQSSAYWYGRFTHDVASENRRSPPSMPYTLIPRNDPALATRVRRQLMGIMSYAMFSVPLLYAVAHGWITFGYQGLAWFVTVALGINVVFFVAIRGGLTRRLVDPSMMMTQVALAGLMALVIAYHAREAMVMALALFFTSFFFGVFSFSLRQYLALTAAMVVAYASMLALKYDVAERSGEAYRLELLHFMILVLVLLWMSLLGSYIASLRSGLAQKKAALAEALARLQEQASRDQLTGLHNRRHLTEMLEQQHERAMRHNEPFALCILDLDHFKRINDTHGHNVGDEVLREFGERARTHLRRMDMIGRAEAESTFGRYGGEEFLLLLPYADVAGALACLERLRLTMSTREFVTSAGPLTITFSAGVAHYRRGETIDVLLSRADAALYRAKGSGRDRIDVAD